MKNLLILISIGILIFGVVGQANALSFSEDFEAPYASTLGDFPAGWNFTPIDSSHRSGVYDPTSTQYTGLATGETVVWINPASSRNQISRYLGENLILGSAYSFKVDVGWRDDRTTKPLYELVFGAKINSVWTELATFGNADADLTKGQFVQVDLQYLATGFAASDVLGEIGIQLRSAGGGQVNFDNISVTSAVPEPATLLLLGSGLAGLGIFGRRRKK
jgi:hypothetical protein